MFIRFLLSILTIWPIVFHAQWSDLQFENLGEKEGYTARGVRSIVQDSIGFIYFATESGLLRYDGIEFEKVIIPDTDYSHSLEIYSLETDHDKGILWIGMDDRLVRFNPLDKSLKSYQLPRNETTNREFPMAIRSILVENRYVWFSGNYSLHRLDRKTNEIKSYWVDNYDPNAPYGVFSLLSDNRNPDIIWMAVNLRGLVRFHKSTGTFKELNCNLLTAFQDTSGMIWGGSWDKGMVRYDPVHNVCNYFSIDSIFPEIGKKNVRTSHVFPYRDKFWMAASHGIVEFDHECGEFKRILKAPENDQVSNFYEDNFGNIWVGSFGGPVKVLDPKKQYYEHFSLNAFEATTRYYPGYQIYDHLKDRYLVVSGTRKKIYVIPSDQGNVARKEIIETGFPIRGITRYSENNLLIASFDRLFFLEEETDRIRDYNNPEIESKGLDKIGIWQLNSDPGSSMSILGHDGFIYYDVSSGKASSIPWKEEYDPNNTPPFFWESYKDAFGEIWLSYNNYICRFNPRNELFIQYKNILSDPHPGFRSVFREADTLWTLGKSLEKFTIREKELVHVEDTYRSSLLSSTGGNKIHADNKGRFWIFSQNGLHCFHRKTGEYHRFGIEDGLQNTFLDPQTCQNLDDGRILTHAGNGIMIFHPDSVWNSVNSRNSKIAIKKIRISGVEQSEVPLHSMDEIILEPGQKFLEIEYQSLNLPFEHGTNYSYRIEELSADWVFNGKSKHINLTGLSPGSYTLEIKTGHKNTKSKIRKLVISVPTPFIRKSWVQLAMGLLAVFFLYWLYQLRISMIRKEEALKTSFHTKLAEVEMQALRAQMNPHFMFNSLNSIKSYILKSGPLEAAEYLTSFASLIRAILHNSREKQISLSSELDALLLYVDLEKMRFPDKFEFVYRLSEKLDPDKIMIPPLILQPYVENAIWHGLLHKEQPGHLMISLYEDGGLLYCKIEDDGIGRKKAGELKENSARRYKSMGMGITKSRIDLHNRMSELGITVKIEDKKDQYGEAAGTIVIISFPKRHYYVESNNH